MIKIYILFRLPRQRWTNRGNNNAHLQTSGKGLKVRNVMATYLTTLYTTTLVLFLALYTGTLETYSWVEISRALKQLLGLY